MTNEYNISLVLNIHKGTKYLRRTLLSLEEAADYARGLGVGAELVFVMDRSPSEACSWARAYQSPSSDHVQYIEVRGRRPERSLLWRPEAARLNVH
jgi:hypothetical protein